MITSARNAVLNVRGGAITSRCSSFSAEFRQMHDSAWCDLQGCGDDAVAAYMTDAGLTG
jgi:hypothetical protein